MSVLSAYIPKRRQEPEDMKFRFTREAMSRRVYMYIRESLKRTIEQVTGRGKPSESEARRRVVDGEAKTFVLRDDGKIPNNALPLVVYRGAVDLGAASDPAAVFEELFAANGWGDSWRNGIYDYVHYHSRIHEVLGIARGRARVQFGGPKGEEIDVAAGDVAVLPAGTGHQCLMASDDFLVVGAYPPDGTYDECRGAADEHKRAKDSIPKVPAPSRDPIHGADGPIVRLWRSD
jgi:uncharacterized protein YjlB